MDHVGIRVRTGSPYRGKVFAHFPEITTIYGRRLDHLEAKRLGIDWLHIDQVAILTSGWTPIRIVLKRDIIEEGQVIPDTLVQEDRWETDILSSKEDSSYHVVRTGSVWTCECRGFEFRKTCRHIGEAKQLEAWEIEERTKAEAA